MSERVRNLAAVAVIAVSAAVVVAVLASSPPTDTDRVEHLATILKCPFCANESIASSPSDVARELHVLIEEWVAEGRSDDEIIDFFVATYGEDVLLDPPDDARTVLLWVLPLIATAVGVAVVIGRRRRPAPATVDPADRALVEAALREREQEL
ncbi:MAG TPA: cytochrome c-type biogenesis protein CcmH [Acidimicrobiia bacterium]|nr:cytochrome c-type biogenesis protein CcmH [Acidimicrobiia bacterium]